MSCCSQFFSGNQPFSFDLGELGRYDRGYKVLMQRWRDVVPKGVMIDVEYNKLVDDLKRQARTLMQPPVAALNPETPSRVHDRECAFA
jgi:sulfotransferase family protein